MLGDSQVWNLTIHFYPHVPSDQSPEPGNGYDEWKPNQYKVHTFRFDFPPNRSDFLRAVNRLPWASEAFNRERGGISLIQSLEQSEWPIVDYCHKAAYTDLMNGDVKVGELEVSYDDVWRATSYDRVQAFSGISILNDVLSKNPSIKDKAAAKQYAYKHENYVRLRLLFGDRQFDAWRAVLVKGEFLKARKKAVSK